MMRIPHLIAALALLPMAAIAGPVDVNSADEQTLARELTGVGPAKARAIVEYREANGPFSSPEELLNVQGIGTRTLEDIRDDLRFRGTEDPGGESPSE